MKSQTMTSTPTGMNKSLESSILQGMKRQMHRREIRLNSGERHIGWKFGFGAPDSLRRLNLEAPLIGFLTDSVVREPGDSVSVKGWTRPVAEPEIAIRLQADLPAAASRETARAAISTFGPSIELADVNFAPDDIESILEGNIYNRHILFGPTRPPGAAIRFEDLLGRVRYRGIEVASTKTLQALTGDILENVCHAATLLSQVNEKLSAGDVVIMGSVVPPIQIETGGEVQFELEPVGSLSVNILV